MSLWGVFAFRESGIYHVCAAEKIFAQRNAAERAARTMTDSPNCVASRGYVARPVDEADIAQSEGIAAREWRHKQRSARKRARVTQTYADLGMHKVRGAQGGTYYE